MRNRFARILPLVLAGAILTGCATLATQSQPDNSAAASPGTSNPGAVTDRGTPPEAP